MDEDGNVWGIGNFSIRDKKQAKEYVNKWKANHFIEWKEIQNRFNENHPNYQENYRSGYYIKNGESIIKRVRKYQQTKKGKEVARKSHIKYIHSEKGIERYNQPSRLKNRIKNQEKFKQNHPNYQKDYSKTEEGKKAIKKTYNKRRGLGSIALNKPFKNSDGHHIDKNHIIYIPKKIHQSIRHNVWTGKGMMDINKKAFLWLAIQEDLFCFDVKVEYYEKK